VSIEYCWTSLVKTLGTARNCQIAIEVFNFGATASAITYFNNGYSEFEHTQPGSEREQHFCIW
jgi:hypothetical protein